MAVLSKAVIQVGAIRTASKPGVIEKDTRAQAIRMSVLTVTATTAHRKVTETAAERISPAIPARITEVMPRGLSRLILVKPVTERDGRNQAAAAHHVTQTI